MPDAAYLRLREAAQALVDAEMTDSAAVEKLARGEINEEWQADTRRLADEAFADLCAALVETA